MVVVVVAVVTQLSMLPDGLPAAAVASTAAVTSVSAAAPAAFALAIASALALAIVVSAAATTMLLLAGLWGRLTCADMGRSCRCRWVSGLA